MPTNKENVGKPMLLRCARFASKTRSPFWWSVPVLGTAHTSGCFSRRQSLYYRRLKTYKQIGYQIIAEPVAQKQPINAFFDSDSYLVPFETDLRQAEKSIVIFSPVVSHARVKRFLEIITSRQGSGVLVSVFTLSCESLSPSHAQTAARLQTTLKQAGVLVEPRHGLHGHFAVIDERVVWYGNANLLSRSKEDDSLMRIENRDIALELLETFCKEPPVSAEFSTE